MHDGDLFVLTHRLQCGTAPSHFWDRKYLKKQKHFPGRSLTDNFSSSAPAVGCDSDIEIDLMGVEDGPAGNTSQGSGHRHWGRTEREGNSEIRSQWVAVIFALVDKSQLS